MQARIGAVCVRLGYGGMAESYFSAAKSVIMSEGLDVMPKKGGDGIVDMDWLLVSSLFLSQQGKAAG